jgi:hypothetical protein
MSRPSARLNENIRVRPAWRDKDRPYTAYPVGFYDGDGHSTPVQFCPRCSLILDLEHLPIHLGACSGTT